MQKGQALIFLLIGILILAVAGGAYYLGRQTTYKSLPNPTVTSQTQTPTPTSDETANWKVYTNTKYGFSFKHPEELIFSEKGGYDQYTKLLLESESQNSDIQLLINVTSKSEQELLESTGEQVEKRIINVSSLSVNKYSGMSGVAGTLYRERVFIPRHGLTIEFNFGTRDQKDVLDKILSTFKFTQ